jgi:hypothetical protein
MLIQKAKDNGKRPNTMEDCWDNQLSTAAEFAPGPATPVQGPALPKSDQAGLGRRWTAGFSPLPRILNRLQDRQT